MIAHFPEPGPEAVDQLLIQVSLELTERLGELVDEHVRVQLRTFPGIADDEAFLALMRSTVRETVAVELDHVAHEMDVETMSPPASVTAWARRVAQRRYPLSEILRAYQLEHTLLMRQYLIEIDRAARSRELAMAAVLRINELSSTLHQRVFISHIAETYDLERARLIRTRVAARQAVVGRILSGQDVDIDAAEQTLGYRLRGEHVAVVVRVDPGASVVRAQAVIEVVVRSLGAVARTAEPPLYVHQDDSSGWAWLFRPRMAPAAIATAWVERGAGRDAAIAIGGRGSGPAGFRASHRQALLADAVARVADVDPPHRALAFERVGVVGMLCHDIEATRVWVASTLGRLAEDTPTNARLRETLAAFLAGNGSFLATAETLFVHRNTVKYRVDQAKDLLPGEVGSARTDVELALRACALLGRAVLTSG